MKIKKLN